MIVSKMRACVRARARAHFFFELFIGLHSPLAIILFYYRNYGKSYIDRSVGEIYRFAVCYNEQFSLSLFLSHFPSFVSVSAISPNPLRLFLEITMSISQETEEEDNLLARPKRMF